MTIAENNKEITKTKKYIGSLRKKNESDSISDTDIEINNQAISDAHDRISEIEEDTRQRRISRRDQIDRKLAPAHRPISWDR